MCELRTLAGELAGHKRSLTHCPSSQGWVSRGPMFCVYVCVYVVSICVCGGGGGGSMLLGWVPFFLFTLPVHYLLVCYIHVCSCTFYTYNAGGDIGGRGGGHSFFS